MPNKLIKDLIDKGAVTLKEQGYSIRSSEYTLLTWKQFQEFCNKKGYETYLPSHKDEFITELGKCTPPLRQSTIDRKAGSMKMLDLLATKGTWGRGCSILCKSCCRNSTPFLMRRKNISSKPVIQNAPEKRCEIISP